MAVKHDVLAPPTNSVLDGVRRFARECAFQDWVVLVFFATLLGAVLLADPSPARTKSLTDVCVLLAVFVGTLTVIRGLPLRHGVAAPLIYRLGMFGPVQLSYFILANLLPVVNPGNLDEALYQLDLKTLGVEPAVWLDQVVSEASSEWFAFFYFSYFFLLALHVLPMLFLARDRRMTGEFTLGMILLVCVVHVSYMLVPGFGPIRHLSFEHALPSGMWHDIVVNTVNASGAQKDIFPSLHTAGPAFCALYSFRHRDKRPFCYTWPIVTFFSLNIIVATMYMRWHWAVDVVVGLSLAYAISVVSPRITRWELKRRTAQGLTEVWPRFAANGGDAHGG
ncbi:MAG: phosphatase PAP2 family protein [Polyangiaceae bacterium]|nr:phosphatase PAP2 family protein [Polyangiaceae bacterium]MCW5791864.1 phosphatase PAP2 family protein [Polyangiaceae bacterium]